MKRLSILAGFLAAALLLTACATGRTSGDPAENLPTEPTETTALPQPTEPANEESTVPVTEAPETEAPTEEPTETAAPELTTREPQIGDESSAFTGAFPDCDETIYGVIYNAPFTNGDPR